MNYSDDSPRTAGGELGVVILGAGGRVILREGGGQGLRVVSRHGAGEQVTRRRVLRHVLRHGELGHVCRAPRAVAHH